MTLAIECIHNLPPHLSYVPTLPDIMCVCEFLFQCITLSIELGNSD